MRGSKHRIPWRTRNDENSCDLTAPPPSSSRNRTVAEVRVDADDNGPLSVFRRAKERQPDISGRVVPVIAVLAKISPGFAELMKGGDARYGLRVAESLEAAQGARTTTMVPPAARHGMRRR